jgi:hypothetical protein
MRAMLENWELLSKDKKKQRASLKTSVKIFLDLNRGGGGHWQLFDEKTRDRKSPPKKIPGKPSS